MTNCIFGFSGHFYFIFLSTIQDKWKFTHTNFLVQWMKIMRAITQLQELSEQYIIWIKNKKIRYTPFFYIKVGFKGVYISRTCFPDVCP